MYKEEGNEWMKAKTENNYHAARDCYTYAMTFIAKEMIDPPQDDNELEALHQLQATLLSNRAMVSLALGNYGECLKDTNVSIALWPKNIKTYYRRCKALFALKRFQECMDCCHDGLIIDPHNKDMLQLQEDSERALMRIQQLQNEKTLNKKKLRRDRSVCFNIAKKNNVSNTFQIYWTSFEWYYVGVIESS